MLPPLRHLCGGTRGKRFKQRPRHRGQVWPTWRGLLVEQLEQRDLLSSLASLLTDQADYQPGAVVEITGTDFDPNEAVTLQVAHSDGLTGGAGHDPWTVVADAEGSFSSTWLVDPDDSAGASFVLTAMGDLGSSTSTTFTDSTLSWDPGHTPGGSGSGGTGPWNTSSANWSNGVSDVIWNNGNNDAAVFAGNAGTVTVGTVTAGSLAFNTTGYILASGTLTLAGVSGGQINVGTGLTDTISSVIAGSGVNLTKIGSGTLALTANTNTFTGAVAVNAGTLSFSNAGNTGGSSLGAGSSILLGNGTTPGVLNYTGVGGTLASTRTITISGSGGGTIRSSAGTTLTVAGTVITSGNQLALDGNSGSVTVSGAVTGTGAVTVSGNGTGRVNVTGSISGNVTVASGGTLGGSGTGTVSGSVSVQSGGSISPGTATTGTGKVSTGSVSFASGSTFSAEVNGSTAGTNYDQLNVTGTVNLGGSTLVLSGTVGTAPTTDVVLINNDGTDAVVGTFNGLAEGASVPINGIPFYITYAGGSSNNDVVLRTRDLKINSFQLIEPDNKDVTITPYLGEELCVRANYTGRNLPANTNYTINYIVDGVARAFSVNFGGGFVNSTDNAYTCGWFASDGPHTVQQITLDSDNTIVEADETNNTLNPNFTFTPLNPLVDRPLLPPSSLPNHFLNPLGGVMFQDWRFQNYVDVNPVDDPSGQQNNSLYEQDYNGGPFSYDGHDGHDISLPDFARMDEGIPEYAAADGTVVDVHDGEFDRQSTQITPSPPANYIVIDHGNGWHTIYYHQMANTITVKLNDHVTAGQLLGYAGSAGFTDGPHLHFQVEHNGAVVETRYDPTDYYISPLPYQADEPTTVQDAGITNFTPTSADFKERPADQSVFSTAAPKNVVFWFRSTYFNAGDSYLVKWYRPNGTLSTTFSTTFNAITRGPTGTWILGSSALTGNPGTWRVAVEMNGVELVSRTFTVVTSGSGASGIKVAAQDGTILIDNRTTAYDFGSVASGGTAISKTFAITNHGTAALTLSNLVLPPGFALSGSLPSSIAAGASANLTVNLTTSAVGFKFGAIQFTTNDPDTPTFNFDVSGTVTGAAPTGTPAITLPAPALDYEELGQASVIDSTATVTDSDSANFGGGNLKVEFTYVSSLKDALGIENAGGGAGQIGVNGTSVTYGGVTIGTFSGGSNGVPLVVSFNTNATPAAAQELVRNVTFNTMATDPQTLARYVRFTLVDAASGKTSNLPFAVVDQNLRPTTVSLDGGNLVIADSSRTGKDDNWRFERSGSNLLLTDVSGNTIDVSSIPGAAGNASSAVTIPLNVLSPTGQIWLDMRQGVDALTIDIANGSPMPAGGILYIGNPPLGRGDTLTITNGGVGTAVYSVDPTTATFAGVPNGSQVPYGATTLIVNYHAGDGNDVALVPNHAPTAIAGGPYSVTYGDGVMLDGSGSADPDNDSLSYTWTINGQANAAGGAQPMLSWTVLAGLGLSTGNSYAVSVTVDDGHGHVVTSADTTLTVNPAGSVVSVSANDATYDGDPHGGTAEWNSTEGDGEGAPLIVIYVGIHGTSYGPTPAAPANAGDYQASATFAGDANHNGSSSFANFTIHKTSSATVTTGDGPFTYDGTTHTGGSGAVTGAGGLSTVATSLTYDGDQVDAGTYYVTAHYAGDANHEASDGEAVAITINKASSTTVTGGDGPFTYDGTTYTGGSGAVNGAGGLSTVATSLTYDGDQVDAGTYYVTAHYAGDANHEASDGEAVAISIQKASSVTIVSCPVSVTYNGSGQMPCTATATGAGGLNQGLAVSYGNNMNVGMASASASLGGDLNHTGSNATATFDITKADALFAIVGYSLLYDGQPHTATGTATGVNGEDLSGLLNLSGTTHTDPANYLDTWTFAGNSNYKSAIGFVADQIAIPSDGFSIDTQAALNVFKAGDIVATVKALGVDDLAALELLATDNYEFRFVFSDSRATVTVTASIVAGSYLGASDTDFALAYRNLGSASPLSALISSTNTNASTAAAVTFTAEVNINGTWVELGSTALKAFLSKK